jgi:hypothetical protein
MLRRSQTAFPLGSGAAWRAGINRRGVVKDSELAGRFSLKEVATANSSWELAVGSSSKEKPAVTKAVTVMATAPCGKNVREKHRVDLLWPTVYPEPGS